MDAIIPKVPVLVDPVSRLAILLMFLMIQYHVVGLIAE